MSHKFGKFSAMTGLRAEYTYTKGESPTMDTTFSHSYLGWFPSIYLQYQINDRQALNLSYSRKINRPGYSSLNPFRQYSDPFTFFSGNPDLQPEYQNTMALRYNIGGYMVNAGYSVVNDVFEKEFIQDDAGQTTQITQNNIGKRQQLMLSGYAPIKFTKWYTLNISVQTSYNMVDAYYNGKPLKKKYFDANTSLQHVFAILPTMRANVQMRWRPPSWSGLIANYTGSWRMNAQIEKTFLDRRLSLTLSCNDIFGSWKWTGTINYGNINQTFKENFHSRQTLFTVRYSFGSQQIRGARNRSVGIEEEMGRTQ
jgi:outer membrane receptor protein involved in Fe transport